MTKKNPGPQNSLNGPTDTWLDTQEVLQWLKIKGPTLKKWRKNKIIGYAKMGGKVFYNKQEIHQQLASQLKAHKGR